MNKTKEYSLSFVMSVRVFAKSENEAWGKVNKAVVSMKEITYDKIGGEICSGVYDPATGKEIENNND